MPSLLHEVLGEMFLKRPAFAAELLAGPLGMALPDFTHVSLSSAELTTLAPTEYRADAVVVLKNDQRAVLAILVEIQLSDEAAQRRSWPSYVVGRIRQQYSPRCWPRSTWSIPTRAICTLIWC